MESIPPGYGFGFTDFFRIRSHRMLFAVWCEAKAALEEVERLLSGPSLLSDHTVRRDPRQDPIREHPRFKELPAKYAGN